jgi:ubiquinol-cytochrome c reductase cytochrome b subunit
MFSRIVGWINDRWPLRAVIRWGLEEEMVGGTSYAYIFGSSLFVVFLLQAITGIWQLFYFVPTVKQGYDSLSYLRTQVPFGWLIHGMHYWGASAMVILIGLHLSRVYLWGAYKHPRQLTWLIGVGLLLFTLALGFTGPVLPWDERGYWEAEVGTSMAGTAPYIGNLIRELLRGGPELGQLTLSRFFVLHVAILPAALLLLIGLHLVAFRQFGISGPWDPIKRERTGPFWPDQIFKDSVIITSISILLVGLSAYFPPPFSGPKDVMITSYVPKPEWYFLFLYQSLKAFHAKWEPIGTLGIPLFVVLLLLFLPFFDRSPERNPRRRPAAVIGYLIFISWVITLAIVGYYSHPPVSTAGSSKSAAISVDPSGQMSASATEGSKLFHSLGCLACHRVNGQGGTLGPDLSSGILKGKSRQWLATQVQNPKAHFPSSIMPAFSSLERDQLNALVDYLMTLTPGGAPAPSGPSVSQPKVQTPAPSPPVAKEVKIIGPQGLPEQAAYIIGNVELGKSLFGTNCESCHGPQGTDKVPNPGSTAGTVPPLNPINPSLGSQDAQTFAENIDRYIQHGSIPQGPNPALHMQPFGDSTALSQAMISDIEAYVLHLNGVDRTQIVHPGIEPRLFFWLVVAAFGVIWLVLFVLWTQ